jgi:actin-related protein 6
MSYLLDNGAYSIKLGARDGTPEIFQNCLGRSKKEIIFGPGSLVGITEVLRPYEKGILVDSDLQSKIWKVAFQGKSISSIVYTCPIYTPASCRKVLDELIYEEFCIPEALRVPVGVHNNCLLVDMGFSTSLVTPIYNGFPINYAVKKTSVGGKLLTNFMKEQISYRYFDMTEETWLVNIIREKMCYVSNNFLCELRALQ